MGADKTPGNTAKSEKDGRQVLSEMIHAAAEDAAARTGKSLEEGKRCLSEETREFWQSRVRAGHEFKQKE